MDIVIGGGLSGLILARDKGALILERQPYLGGLVHIAFQQFHTPTIPILVREKEVFERVLKSPSFEEFVPQVVVEKEEHLKEKVCDECTELPSWLNFEGKLYLVRDVTSELTANVRVLYAYPTAVDVNKRKVITNKGSVIKYDTLYVTGSRIEMDKMLGVKEPLSYVSLYELILLLPHRETEWNVYVNGNSGVSFSHVIKVGHEDFDVYYVYAFFKRNQRYPDSYRVFGDLKRLRIATKDQVLGYRTLVVKEAILFGAPAQMDIEGVKFCGRLGLWSNLSVEETIEQARKC
ncbi:MAG: hypothetical protein MPF33_03310 [Candidatus Aramenus sp.]|jgi:hypothetical protein|nr:hypothetical protein [Candidatus Aramenus sp.]